LNVTVIITVYNRAHLLRKALLSLSQQSYQADEVILSDDGSQEDVRSVIRAMSSLFTGAVKYILQEHRGFRAAKCRNNAVRIAKGNCLVFLDSDLVFTRHFLKILVDYQRPGRFCSAYAIRLTPEQTLLVDDNTIRNCTFQSILKPEQLKKIEKQYRKDKLYAFLKQLHLRSIGPKLRSGVTAIHRADYIRVNGFDENYQGWGNEDDDLGRRLYRAGIHGLNPGSQEFPLHLYHEPFHQAGKRVNLPYHRQRIKQIDNGNYRCIYGIDNPLGDDKIMQIDLK
jgi:glycosyltransferase involved in cell wall biosynthesis